MTKNKKLLMLVSGLVILAIIAVLLKPQNKEKVISTSNETTSPTAILEILAGEPEVKLPGEEFKIAVNSMEITAGTIIKTNNKSRAQILYTNKSVTRLDFNTEITLENLENEEFQAKVNLGKGRIWSRIAKLFGKETYESESDKLVATIRGTSYGHGILASGEDQLVVTKSKTLGKCLNETQEAEVVSGNKATFTCLEGKKVFPVLITFQDKKDQWYIFNNEEDKKLDEEFGKETYDDELVLSATPKPTPTPTPITQTTNTPAPTPTPLSDTSGPTINKFNVSPMLVGRQGCSASFQAEITDPSGVKSGQVVWQSFDSNNAPVSSGRLPMSPKGTIWYASGQLSVPPYGHIEWQVEAYDNLGNVSLSNSGININTDSVGCI